MENIIKLCNAIECSASDRNIDMGKNDHRQTINYRQVSNIRRT